MGDPQEEPAEFKVGLVNIGGCEGCSLSFLKALPKLRAAGLAVCCAYLQSLGDESFDVLFISGALCRQSQKVVELVRSLRRRARTLVALGSCAALGGVMRFARGGQEPRPEHHLYAALPTFVPVDYSLPGCPPPPGFILSFVANLRKGNEKALGLFSCVAKVDKLSGLDLMDDVVLGGLCVSCGACEVSCPTQAIRLVDGRPYLSPERCIRCGACYVRCPVGRQILTKRSQAG